MIRVHVRRKIGRNGDPAIVTGYITLPVVPRAGDFVTLDMPGRSIEVERVELVDGESVPIVHLKGDWRAFKAADKFDAIVADHTSRGWDREN